LQARNHVRFSHETHLARSSGGCTRCHAGVARQESRARPSMGICLSCHPDRSVQRDCKACHTDLAKEIRPPDDHLVHGDNFLATHGRQAASSRDLCAACHAERFCASCHGLTVPALPSRLAFDRPDGPSVHRAGFSSRHAEESHQNPGLCSTCHTEETCLRCHQQKRVDGNTAEARRNPHPPGWVGVGPGQNQHGPAARRDPLSCSSCHGGAGETLCIGCHRVGGIGGNPHPPGFSSRKSQRELPCRLCHVGI
jgi:hypothetical protein